MLNLTKYIEPANDKSFVSCAYEDHIPYSAGFVGTITLFSAIFLLMLLGAAYDCYLRYHRKNSSKMVVYTNTSTNNSAQNGRAGEAPINDDTAETKDDDTPLILVQEPPKHAIWEQFLLSFALNRNLAKLLNTNPGADRTIGCLNGLRVISMAWVILGHTFFFPSQMGIIGQCMGQAGVKLNENALTSSECERSFSALRRLKTWLRSTMTQKRLNAVAVCNSHHLLLDNISLQRLVKEFAGRNEKRRKIFGF
eukprot:XP_011670515.1 PREDICTED: uncharacterized protein LOC105441264 [Strongylocentrotus purpuratus]